MIGPISVASSTLRSASMDEFEGDINNQSQHQLVATKLRKSVSTYQNPTKNPRFRQVHNELLHDGFNGLKTVDDQMCAMTGDVNQEDGRTVGRRSLRAAGWSTTANGRRTIVYLVDSGRKRIDNDRKQNP
ncbi:unnamed protein product [Citrullus colocynthis]|uniref:Uncharacterized protein n=1 Tax=Citrullus colocynthis TaxID=252529 RepID=A0ABP0XTU6_9ROSI